jgi:hypothetical protein
MRARLTQTWMFWKSRASSWPVFIAVTLLCLILRENYPFSNFPMYSSFAKKSFVIYLTDASGNALPTARFGLGTSTLQKIFGAKRVRQPSQQSRGKTQASELDKAAAIGLLQYLDELPVVRARRDASLHGLQVRRINIVWKAGRISSTTETLAQHP